MLHSSRASAAKKPRPSFPLTAHRGARQWCKKVRGKIYYFGKLDDPASAETRYNRERLYLESGLPIPEDLDGLTLRDMCNRFMSHKEAQRNNGEITTRHFDELLACCKRMLEVFDGQRVAASLTTRDFEHLREKLAGRFGLIRLGNEVTKTRSIFNYAHDAGLLESAMRFGPAFRGPSKRALRQNKATRPKRLFLSDELLLLLMAAGEPLESMTLLGINAGLGCDDCAKLSVANVDLQQGWLDFPRPKTGIERRVPLWPETIAALKEIIGVRKGGLVYATRWGNAWHGDLVSQRFAKLLRECGMVRDGRGFYGLRHTLQTIGGNAKDPDALRAIMGHVDASISAHYREGIDDNRLVAVANVVRQWLFGTEGGAA